MSRFRQFVRKLRRENRLKEFAEKANTTEGYVVSHLFTPNKVPRRKLWRDLVNASNGELDDSSMIEHFINREKESA